VISVAPFKNSYLKFGPPKLRKKTTLFQDQSQLKGFGFNKKIDFATETKEMI